MFDLVYVLKFKYKGKRIFLYILENLGPLVLNG
jgi:hypothetical protein